ncbi:Double-stranded RNA-binding domain [Dillenia turbinata]|uniref:protein-serine/threonine phosphatase n=1 Tax=Dillenia turbinata TaxID=194707 RepID=A0AAN8YY89_9MAGN
MMKFGVYEGENLLGEVEIIPQNENMLMMMMNNNNKREIRISKYSQPSDRCPPLAVLHTISSSGLCFKMESATKFQSQDNMPLSILHSTCLRDNKTAVMSLGQEELHLVAMSSKKVAGQYPCFWGYIIASGLYNSCLVMLNLRCLGIVFDLDETLIVANTMRSFEDRIEALQRKIATEVDPQRLAGMLAEVKRYQDDKNILKQYAESDQVVDNGKVLKIQSEIVPALSDSHQPIIRPLIRLQDKNIILTRINPSIRDTSVLVRLRPAWEDLRSYLTARGRKRFEVYVCTMAERDYALEMWRLLDPESNLINTKELFDRIVCVKSGSRKSLFNVFQDGICHPKMSLVIDDRLKVWDEKDQPRVHVVPAFAPYYAPQAEANNAVPVLCVARNVACNVRGGFFKEFDDSLLQWISEVAYEDDQNDIPLAPDVSNYLAAEDDPSSLNGNKDPLSFDGMADIEVERRLKEAMTSTTAPSAVPNIDPRLGPLQYAVASSSSIPMATPSGSVMPFPVNQFPQAPSMNQFPQAPSVVKPLCHVGPVEPSLQNSPAREEGEVPESELDPDTRRRLLILQHGQDTRDLTPPEPPIPVRPPLQVSILPPQMQSRGGWFPVEEEMSPGQPHHVVPKEFPLNSEQINIEKHRPHHPPFMQKMEGPIRNDRFFHENQRFPREAPFRDDRSRFNHLSTDYHSFPGEIPLGRTSSNGKDHEFELVQGISNGDIPAVALQDIAMKCRTKVEFRPSLVPSTELQFSVVAWFAGEKSGEGIGRTRREAQSQAAEGSLRYLANRYLSYVKPDVGSVQGDVSRFSAGNENGFISDSNSFGNQRLPKEDSVPYPTNAAETSRHLDPRLDGSRKPMGPVSALKEMCLMEGLDVVFQAQPPHSNNALQKDEICAQVEIDGQVLGVGTGLTWDEAKAQAADKALGHLKSMLGQFNQKRQASPRSLHGMPNKRLKPDFSRSVQRMPSSARYPRNASPVL